MDIVGGLIGMGLLFAVQIFLLIFGGVKEEKPRKH